MLGGEPDGAVRLERRTGGLQCGIGCGDFRRADVAGRIRGVVSQRQCRAVHQRPSHLHRDVHVGELVLDGLVAADHAAELAALLGVFDRHVQHRLAGADQLRGGGQDAEFVGARHIGGRGAPMAVTSNRRRLDGSTSCAVDPRWHH